MSARRIARRAAGSTFSRNMDKNRKEASFQWDMKVVRLRNKLDPILDAYKKLEHLTTMATYLEFENLLSTYYEDEKQFTKMFNDPKVFPFGLRAGDHMDKIIQQLEALVFYLKLLP